jgi:hypothetical protein
MKEKRKQRAENSFNKKRMEITLCFRASITAIN